MTVEPQKLLLLRSIFDDSIGRHRKFVGGDRELAIAAFQDLSAKVPGARRA
jgi:hypothetical protein